MIEVATYSRYSGILQLQFIELKREVKKIKATEIQEKWLLAAVLIIVAIVGPRNQDCTVY